MKNLFRSIFSNQAVLDGRKTKWYFILAMFVLSIFLPWIPALSKGYQTDGSAFLTATNNNEIDKGFKTILGKDYFKNITIEQNADGSYFLNYAALNDAAYYSEDEADFENEYNGTNTKELFRSEYTYTNATTKATETHAYYFDCISVEKEEIAQPSTSATTSTVVYENNGRNTYLQAFFFADKNVSASWLSDFLMHIVFRYDDKNKPQRYPHSYALFNTDEIRVASFPLKTSLTATKAGSSYYGSVKVGFKNVVTGTKLGAYLYSDSTSVEAATKKFQSFLYQASRPSTIKSVWYNCLYLTIFAFAAMLIASLILLFLNKRKTSLYRDTNYWECMKEAVLLSFSPCLISMAIGFMNFTYGVVAIVACILIRVVWISSKITPPPTQGGNSQPLYQARS